MNKKSSQVIAAIVIAVIAFGAGWEIKGTSSSPTATTAGQSGTFAATGGTRSFGGAGRGGAASGGFVGGKIVSVDPTSISVALPNSTSTSATTGSTVVLYSTGTSIQKSIIGSSADLSVGENVMVSGTTNSDGSVSATSIQIRPTSGQ